MRQQLSLLSVLPSLAGVMPAVRAAMRRAAGDPDSDGRKALVDRINTIARDESIQLTGGNVKQISKDTLDKWVSPSDVSHAPGVLAILAFCRAAETVEPLRVLLHAMQLDIMTGDDRMYRDLGRAETELKAARRRKRQLEGLL